MDERSEAVTPAGVYARRVTDRSDVLELTATMTERTLAPGEVLLDQGGGTSLGVAVLVEGELVVELGGAPISEITIPGAFVGEIGALLGTARSATVIARAPSRVRLIGDPDAFFAEHPELALELARQLAGRLQRLLAYLADVAVAVRRRRRPAGGDRRGARTTRVATGRRRRPRLGPLGLLTGPVGGRRRRRVSERHVARALR